MYCIFFTIALLCFLFHTTVHVLEHFKKLSEHEAVHATIGISMLLGWFSYFYISFSEFPAVPHAINHSGLVILIIGIYLFIISHAKIHKRMHSRKGELVTDGIYKHIRHPMYLGEILMLLGAPISGSSLLTLALSPLFIIQILVWRYFEEQELMKEFPKEYGGYRKRTWF